MEKEQLIKSNKSAAQQVLDLKENLRLTQIQLRQTEARLQAVLNIISNVNSYTETEVNKIHKRIQKNISQFTDLIGEPLGSLIQQQISKIESFQPMEMKRLSDEFRMIKKMAVLHIEGVDYNDNPQKASPIKNKP